MEKPTLRFPRDVEGELRRYSDLQRQQVEAWFERRLLPSYLLTSERASPDAQLLSLLGRLVGKKAAPAVLPVAASKFGGRPYLEALTEWPRHDEGPYEYLAQINFADLPLNGHVPEAPRQGILVFYLRRDWPCEQPGQCRWYPNPESARALVPPDSVPSVARFETRIGFVPSWTLPGSDAWEDALGVKNERLWEGLLEWAGEFDEARGYSDGSHELFPQATAALLNELQVRELSESTTVLRLSFDPEADFDWGSNYVYYLIRNDDLRAGCLDRMTCTIANA